MGRAGAAREAGVPRAPHRTCASVARDAGTGTGTTDDGATKIFEAKIRLDAPNEEVTYINNGGILQTVLRNLK